MQHWMILHLTILSYVYPLFSLLSLFHLLSPSCKWWPGLFEDRKVIIKAIITIMTVWWFRIAGEHRIKEVLHHVLIVVPIYLFMFSVSVEADKLVIAQKFVSQFITSDHPGNPHSHILTPPPKSRKKTHRTGKVLVKISTQQLNCSD